MGKMRSQGHTSPLHHRYVGLDGYRFVAASFVLFYHYNEYFNLKVESLGFETARLPLMVDFFFILSGFVIAVAYGDRMRSGRDYFAFLGARLGRVYPLHLLTLSAVLAMAGLGALLHLPVNHPEILALSALPANLLLQQAWGVVDHNSFNVPSWSISAEWFVYLLTPLLFLLARRLSFAALSALIVGFVLAMIGCRNAAGLRDWTLATYDFGAFRAVPSFLTGIVVWRIVASLPRLGWPRWWMVHVLFIGILCLMQLGVRPEIMIALFAVLIGLAAVCEREGRTSWITGWLAGVLGDASYSIYMLHGVLSVPILFALRKFGQLGTPAAAVTALVTYLVVIAVAILTYRHFEVPSRRWLAARLGKARDLAANAPQAGLRAH